MESTLLDYLAINAGSRGGPRSDTDPTLCLSEVSDVFGDWA